MILLEKSDKTNLNRELLKCTPKVHLDRILKEVGCIGIEEEIAKKRILEKKSPLDICEELSISESTYYRNFNNILTKIHKVLREINE